MEVLVGKSSINGPFSMAILKNLRVYQILTMEQLTKDILYIYIHRILMNIVQLYTLQPLLCPESCIVDSDNSSSRESVASANPIFDRLYISSIVGKPVSLPKYRPHSFAGYIQGFLFVGIFLFYFYSISILCSCFFRATVPQMLNCPVFSRCEKP